MTAWESATVTVVYDDLTDGAPRQKTLTIDRRKLVTNRRQQMIDHGHAADALGVDIPPDEFEMIVMRHAAGYYEHPLVVEHPHTGGVMVLPTTSVLRVDVEGSPEAVSEGDETSLYA